MSTAQLPATRTTAQAPALPGDIIHSLADLWNLAKMLVESGLLPTAIKTPAAAAGIILKGRELGIPAMESFSGITVIQGKPTVSPQLMLSLINRSGLCADIEIGDESDTAVVMMHRVGRKKGHTERFSMADAKAMQLAGKDNWVKQPKTMRKWRAVAACARIVFPDVIAGMYTPEEMGALVTSEGEYISAPDSVDVEYVTPQPAAPETPQNDTGHGRGQYASPEQRKEFEDRLKAAFEHYATKWLDHWTDKQGGEVLNTAELTNVFELVNHLIKWARESNRLQIHEGRVSTDQGFKYLAVLYHKSEIERKALLKELKRYIESLWAQRTHAFYSKHPEYASREWLEENRPELLSQEPPEVHGDAWEPEEPVKPVAAEVEDPRDDRPTTGVELLDWLKRREQLHSVGLIKYLNGWAKMNEFPGRMTEWPAAMVDLAVAEATRRIMATKTPEPVEETIPY